MWGKNLAFIIIFILAFGILLAWIPTYFGITSSVQDQAALTELNTSNLIIYDASGADNMTQGYSSYTDGPDPPNWNVSLPEGEYLEVWWGQNPVYGTYAIELRHIGTAWWGGPSQIDMCHFYYSDGTPVEGVGWAAYASVGKMALESAWSDNTNSSAFTAKCDHIAVSIVFKPDNGYTDIGEAYNAGYLWYAISYQWNADKTGFNAMALIINLLSFRGINVGVPGDLGTFLDGVISTLFYCCIAVVAYVIITSVIPFIPGLRDT